MKQELFPLVSGITDLKYMLIHPLMQRDVQKIVSILKEYHVHAILFGSSVTNRCNIASDLDLCIKTPQYDTDLFYKIQKRLGSAIETPIDILYYNDLSENERLKEEIDNGVQII